MGHEDRNIADQADVAFVAIGLERKPLFEEYELKELMRFDLIVKSLARSSQRGRFAPGHRTLPFVPCLASMRALERTKESVIVEPRSVLLGECFERAAQFRVGRKLIARKRFRQDDLLGLMNSFKIYALRRQRR